MRVFALPAHGSVTVGRAPENDICLEHPSVSRQHAVLHLGPEVTIQDLGGTNGTFVRDDTSADSVETVGLRQLSGQAARVLVGDSVTLGGVSVVLRRTAQELQVDRTSASGEGDSGIVIRDPSMTLLYAQVELAARALISILLFGETGVGKEVLARAIHARSARAHRPFMGINCAALSGTLLEGELFGYERGAFTGAVQGRPGLFEAADGGSVFLDELGEMPLETQAKVLRLIEERSVTRLGGRTPRAIDVRFISATNRDLCVDAEQGGFRRDLYYRLNGMSLRIPPLRERRADIEPLAWRFAQQAARQLDRREPPVLSSDALEVLQGYEWPGNVRELRNAVERAVVLCPDGVIRSEHLPGILTGQVAAAPRLTQSQPPADVQPVRSELRDIERARIIEVLARCHGNQTQAAKLLGMSRRTLVTRLGQFNLPRPRKK
ncbi:MAG TPA: sigma 54-interacting transcriptional regulator [Polyangiaceae bacterium]